VVRPYLPSRRYSGTVAGVARRDEGSPADAFITEVALPEGEALKGRWVSLAFGRYLVIPATKGEYPLGVREQAERIVQLIELSRLRGVSLDSVMTSLNIPPPPVE
jgi:hypothetical protein